jgi:hypothetical protein
MSDADTAALILFIAAGIGRRPGQARSARWAF